jgi:hypothetical protein
MACVLTRGPAAVRRDAGMDPSEALLASGNGFCKQELVALLLSGRARAGIHDDSNEVAVSVLGPGVPCKQEVGLLVTGDQANMLGEHLRLPALPLWVVLGKAHFSVLFAREAYPLSPPVSDRGAENNVHGPQPANGLSRRL